VSAQGSPMKIKKFIVTALGAFVMASLVAWVLHEMRPKAPEPPPAEDLPEALVVYCFHSNQRSIKCEQIEQWMRELIEKSFAAQVKSRQIVWQVVNVEEPENAHFADAYSLSSFSPTSIVVVDGRPGKWGPAINYEKKAWGLAEDKAAFTDYFRGEIEKALK
jgi:hypothetical protein